MTVCVCDTNAVTAGVFLLKIAHSLSLLAMTRLNDNVSVLIGVLLTMFVCLSICLSPDGFAPKLHRRGCNVLLIGAGAYRLDLSGDTLAYPHSFVNAERDSYFVSLRRNTPVSCQSG